MLWLPDRSMLHFRCLKSRFFASSFRSLHRPFAVLQSRCFVLLLFRTFVVSYSLVSCTPGNHFLIGLSRLKKCQRKRFAMLKSCQNFPHVIFMQISDAITEKCMFRHISVNIADSSTLKVCKNVLKV